MRARELVRSHDRSDRKNHTRSQGMSIKRMDPEKLQHRMAKLCFMHSFDISSCNQIQDRDHINAAEFMAAISIMLERHKPMRHLREADWRGLADHLLEHGHNADPDEASKNRKISWPNFARQVSSESVACRVVEISVQVRYGGSNEETSSALKALWALLLTLVVDCTALFMFSIALNCESSLLLLGYAMFSITMLHVNRASNDVDVLSNLQVYVYIHLVLQTAFFFADTLWIAAKDWTLQDWTSSWIGVIGLERKPSGESQARVFIMASTLFAWILVVKKLMLTESYTGIQNLGAESFSDPREKEMIFRISYFHRARISIVCRCTRKIPCFCHEKHTSRSCSVSFVASKLIFRPQIGAQVLHSDED